MKDDRLKRGSVWWVCGNQYGEHVLGSNPRPGIVISGAMGLETSPVITIVYMTTKLTDKDKRTNTIVHIGSGVSNVYGNQIQTVNRSWLIGWLGQLSEEELARVDRCVTLALGLHPEQVRQQEEERYQALRRKYEAALQLLAQQEVAQDVQRIKEGGTLEPEPVATEKLDLNRATAQELVAAGFNDWSVNGILRGRPFGSMNNVRSYLRWTDAAFARFSQTCCVVWEEPERKPDDGEASRGAPSSVTALRAVPPSPEGESLALRETGEAPAVLRVNDCQLAEMETFLLTRGFRSSHVMGLWSALRKYKKENGAPASSVSQLNTGTRFTAKTRGRLAILEEGGELVF